MGHPLDRQYILPDDHSVFKNKDYLLMANAEIVRRWMTKVKAQKESKGTS